MAPRASKTSPDGSEPGLLLAAGTVLHERGGAADHVFIVQQGEVELQQEDADGARLIARLGAGDPVGAAEMLIGVSHGARAVAATDVRVLQLDRATFEEMCLDRPEIAVRFAEELAGRVGRLEERLAALGMDDLIRPVAKALLRRAEPCENGLRVPVTLRGVAAEAGLSLREAHQALQRLFDDKRVRLVDEALLIPDEASLAAYLNDEPLAR